MASPSAALAVSKEASELAAERQYAAEPVAASGGKGWLKALALLLAITGVAVYLAFGR